MSSKQVYDVIDIQTGKSIHFVEDIKIGDRFAVDAGYEIVYCEREHARLCIFVRVIEC